MKIFSKNSDERKAEIAVSITLAAMIIVSLVLMILQPNIGIISSDITANTGAVMFAAVVIWLPSIIWKFSYNARSNKQ